MKTIKYLGLPTPYSLPIQSKAVNLEGNPGTPPSFKFSSRLVFVGKIFLMDSSNQTSIPANPNRQRISFLILLKRISSPLTLKFKLSLPKFCECLLFVRENLVKPAMIPSQSIKHIIYIGQRQKNQSVCQQYVQKVFSSYSSKTGNHSSLSAGGYNSSWPVSLRHALTPPFFG